VTGTDLWRKVLNKDMSKVKVPWNVKDGVTPDDVRLGKVKDMIRFQEIHCHIVFDIEMDFTRKARFVTGGYTMETPAAMTYSNVVSRDSIRLGFMIAALHGLDIMACNLENAYLNAKCQEKIWFEGGLECGAYKGKVCVVTHALYGLKSMGASWRSAFLQASHDIGFSSMTADPDIWI
jgi:hypothetical protein